MSLLPYLKPKTIPKERKLAGVSNYGFSEDDELCESAIKEIIQAIETKDHKALMEAIKALVHCIRNKHAADALKDPESI